MPFLDSLPAVPHGALLAHREQENNPERKAAFEKKQEALLLKLMG